MDDFEAQLRAFEAKGYFLRWEIIGKDNPYTWNVYSEPDVKRLEQQAVKINRQLEAARISAKGIFPNLFDKEEAKAVHSKGC